MFSFSKSEAKNRAHPIKKGPAGNRTPKDRHESGVSAPEKGFKILFLSSYKHESVKIFCKRNVANSLAILRLRYDILFRLLRELLWLRFVTLDFAPDKVLVCLDEVRPDVLKPPGREITQTASRRIAPDADEIRKAKRKNFLVPFIPLRWSIKILSVHPCLVCLFLCQSV